MSDFKSADKSLEVDKAVKNSKMEVFIGVLLYLTVGTQATDWSYVRAHRFHVKQYEHTRTESRIIGGTVAERHQFPYQVGVVVDQNKLCGGSLISDTVVLTAAHCTYKYSSFEVHLAAQNIMDDGEPDRQIVIASSAITHENWTPSNAQHDIALLVLPRPVSGTGIEVIRLPAKSHANLTFVNQAARISGWGKVSDDLQFPSPELNYVDVTIADNQECVNYYGNIVTDEQICVGSLDGTVGPCSGDSGGPLVYYENDEEPTQIGVVSYGPASGCESKNPNVFTRVTSYLSWLETNAGVTLRP